MGEGFTVEGAEVGMVVVVGIVTSCEKATTKTTYRVQDDSGEIEIIQWLEDGTNQPEYSEGSGVRVVGSIRSQGQDKKHIMALRFPVLALKLNMMLTLWKLCIPTSNCVSSNRLSMDRLECQMEVCLNL